MSRDVCKVLIVDDSEEDRAHVRRLLLKGSERRYRFTEAATGASGIAAALVADASRPDCVVLDYNLPDMDAADVLSAIAGLDGASVCPVVVLTGSVGSELGRVVLRAGAQDFLGKGSMSAESLSRAVENAAERWAMAREVRVAEAEYQSLFEMAAVGNAEVRLPSGLFARANRQFCALTGYSVDELVGQKTFLELTHPDDQARNAGLTAPVLKGAKSGFELETRYLRKDGRVIWIHLTSSLLLDANGTPNRALACVTDITARKQSEEQQQNRERRFRALFDSAYQFIGLLDPDGTVVDMNRTALDSAGTTLDAVVGRNFGDTPWWGHYPAARAQVQDAIPRAAAGEFVRFEAKYLPQDRTEATLDFSIAPIRDEAGRVVQLVTEGRDITERKQLEDALKAADQRKDEFLATLAHELRNPLAPILSGVQLMRLSPGNEKAVVRARDVIERQLGHMVRLVDDLMDVSRINTGKVELKRERIQVRAVIDNAIEHSQALVEAGGHTLTVTVRDEPVWVDGDLTRLAQVVANLLNNAAKYTPNGGRVELSAHVEGNDAVIAVTDNGAGIAVEMLPRVFDLFAQVAGTLSRAQGGLGIGLSLVRKLLELHAGTITAESPGLGLGSTFTVRLPLVAGPQAEPTTSIAPYAGPRAVGRLVLVVDDNEDAAELLTMLLAVLGHDARAVHDGPAALDAARRIKPDVVFLDIGLPGMNGYEVAKQFRADPALATTVLIALTGWGSEDDRRRSKEAGFDHHLTKPINARQVETLLAGLSPVATTADNSSS